MCASARGHGTAVLLVHERMSLAFRSPAMRIPTQLGDVLVLQTERGVKIHAVGRVTEGGQQDLHRIEPPPLYIADHEEAVVVARTLVAPGRRIFLVRQPPPTSASAACGSWRNVPPRSLNSRSRLMLQATPKGDPAYAARWSDLSRLSEHLDQAVRREHIHQETHRAP
jgi:hypothetical protein